ncbi:MAG: TRAP transporter small permease [Woeseia sp.]
MMLERIAQWCHLVSALWVVVLALIIFVDVTGRYLFATPLLGATEVIMNSVVSITFLQLPLAIYRGGMLRTTLILDAVKPKSQRLLRTAGNLLGLVFFVAAAYSSWQPFVDAWQIGEYEGEGALRVPTYPVRFLLVITTAFTALVYFYLLYLDWTGRLEAEHGEPAGI